MLGLATLGLNTTSRRPIGDPLAVASIRLTPSVPVTSGVPVNFGREFTAVALNNVGTELSDDVTIDSATPTIASYDAVTGRMRALAVGTATIRATAGLVTTSVSFSVTPAIALDYVRFSAEDRMMARVLTSGPQDGPFDRGGMTYYPASDTVWRITPSIIQTTDWSSGASTVSNGGYFETESAVIEDAKQHTGTQADSKMEHQISSDEWAAIIAHPSQTFRAGFRYTCPAGLTAGVGKEWRLVVSQPGTGNVSGNNFNPFLDPLDPAQGVLLEQRLVMVSPGVFATVDSNEIPVAAVTDPTKLYVSLVHPLDAGGVLMGIQATTLILIAGKKASELAADNKMHSPTHERFGTFALDASRNCETHSDDFLAAGTTRSADVTITPTLIPLPDAPDDASPSMLQQVFMPAGSYIERTVVLTDVLGLQFIQLQSNVGQAIAPDDGSRTHVIAPRSIWRHMYMVKDGSYALPVGNELKVEIDGALGMYQAGLLTHDRWGMGRWNVPMNPDAMTAENATTITIRYRATVDCHFLASRSMTEPEGNDGNQRDTGYALLCGPKSATVPVNSGQTETKIMRGASILNRNALYFAVGTKLWVNPFSLGSKMDKRLGYWGRRSNVDGFDPKLTTLDAGGVAGEVWFSCSFIGAGVGDDSARFAVQLFPEDFDTTTTPGAWIFHADVTVEGRAFTHYSIKGVEYAAPAGNYHAATGGGSNSYNTLPAAFCGQADCDHVCCTCGNDIYCVTSKTVPVAADRQKIRDGVPWARAA